LARRFRPLLRPRIRLSRPVRHLRAPPVVVCGRRFLFQVADDHQKGQASSKCGERIKTSQPEGNCDRCGSSHQSNRWEFLEIIHMSVNWLDLLPSINALIAGILSIRDGSRNHPVPSTDSHPSCSHISIDRIALTRAQ